MEIVWTWIIAVGAIGTLIGAFLVYRTLKCNHDWQRREYAINLIRDWNIHTSKHWQVLEGVFPHLRDVDRTGGTVTEITKQQAKDIYTCEPDNTRYWELRYHLVEMLNYLEYVSMSYEQKVADQEIVETSLKDIMIKYYDILKNLIDVVETCEGYLPWEPYTALIGKWKSASVITRKPTA